MAWRIIALPGEETADWFGGRSARRLRRLRRFVGWFVAGWAILGLLVAPIWVLTSLSLLGDSSLRLTHPLLFWLKAAALVALGLAFGAYALKRLKRSISRKTVCIGEIAYAFGIACGLVAAVWLTIAAM